MNVYELKRVYFIGAGGIGMSALARFFHERGAKVSGYDRTETELTKTLRAEGIDIHYTDDPQLLDAEAELVVYTPAIPATNNELAWYRAQNRPVFKRSDVLQWITERMEAITVAGTHGKTTVSTMIAYLCRETGIGGNAFLGGIAANYGTNYWSSGQPLAIIEADEYDRSFLKLKPDIAVLTAMDADHLDIYGTEEAVEEAFLQYTRNLKPGGTVLLRYGLKRDAEISAPRKLRYSREDRRADAYAYDVVPEEGGYRFSVRWNGQDLRDLFLPIGGLHNVENAVAAISVLLMKGAEPDAIAAALKNFKGVKRRFQYLARTPEHVYIDDYAHHPEELSALLQSARHLYPERRMIAVFQPHLFSRTRDFAEGFAESLNLADEVWLMDIYPARELPIEGVTSGIIAEKIIRPCFILNRDEILDRIQSTLPPLIITAGAGDIDKLCEPIRDLLA